jgi:hypothetical protein
MPQQWIIIYRNEEICHNSGYCCGIFPLSCILLSTVVAYFLIPVYYYPLLWHISSFLYIIIHCCGILPHSCILLSTVVAYFLVPVYNYPLLWHISSFLYIIIHLIIYRNEEICHNSG